MCQCGNGGIQTGGALAISDQEAQEHANGRRASLRSSPSRSLASLQDERSQARSIEPARIFSQSL
jgi:hypothetical protein